MDVTTKTSTTEIYMSKNAINEDPAFFGHPFKGRNKPKRAGNVPQPELSPRPNVDLRILGPDGEELRVKRDHPLRVWEYVEGKNKNADVRLTVPQEMREQLRELPDGCILEMRRRPTRPGIAYRLDFLAPGSAEWEAARARAVQPLPNSSRKYGWE